MRIIKYLWSFRAKFLDTRGLMYKSKSWSVARGYEKEAGVNFNHEGLYDHIASHEAIRILISYASRTVHILEGGEFPNANLFGKLDMPVYMDQPRISSGEVIPGSNLQVSEVHIRTKAVNQYIGSLMHIALLY